jgi:hypothetical protein
MFRFMIVMFRSNPIVDKFIKFSLLPDCYFKIIKNTEYTKSRFNLTVDLLKLFFSYKTFPNHYYSCRLWEVEEAQWKYYYGSNYQTPHRLILNKTVQPWEYAVLFYDKAVCDLLCRGISVNLPHTYGIISPDQNYKEKIKSWFRNPATDSLIIKPLTGSAGRGIILANKINNSIFIQSGTGLIPLQDFNLSKTAVVQEVIKQDRRMSTFSLSSVNTIRVVTMYTKKESIIILGAIMRCGIGESYIDNWSAGGVAVGIDNNTGRLKKYAYNKEGTRYIEHPTSKVVFEGFIVPQWQRIIDLAVKIQKALPCYRILGMDIAIQENGEPVLVEVNDYPDLLLLEQTCGPLLQVEQNLKAFGEYDLFVNRHQKELYENAAKGIE